MTDWLTLGMMALSKLGNIQIFGTVAAATAESGNYNGGNLFQNLILLSQLENRNRKTHLMMVVC